MKESSSLENCSREKQLNFIAWYPVSYMEIDERTGEAINVYKVDGAVIKFPTSVVLEKRRQLLKKENKISEEIEVEA